MAYHHGILVVYALSEPQGEVAHGLGDGLNLIPNEHQHTDIAPHTESASPTLMRSSYVKAWFCAVTRAWSIIVRASAVRPVHKHILAFVIQVRVEGEEKRQTAHGAPQMFINLHNFLYRTRLEQWRLHTLFHP